MITGIRHLIFDLGGVLLNIDYGKTEQAFIDLGIANFGALYSQMKQSPLFDDFETGRISGAAFIAKIQEISPVPLTELQILDAWNAMLLYFPVGRMELLQQLRLHYDLVLLSNTNEIHEVAFNKILMRDVGMPAIGVFFDKVYLSHRVGMRKPDPGIFQRILDECGFKARETLFIDDSPQHIETAKKLGIQTIHLEPGMTIEETVFRRKL